MSMLIEIFVPRLPCACNPTVALDPALVRFQDGLIALRKRYGNKLTCSIYSLNNHLAQFRRYPVLVEVLQEIGEKGLPVILIDGEMVFQGEYPEPARLETALAEAFE
jgi:hypothetical protein